MNQSLPDPSIIKPRPLKAKKKRMPVATEANLWVAGVILLLLISSMLTPSSSTKSFISNPTRDAEMRQIYADHAYKEAYEADYALDHGDAAGYRKHKENAEANVYLYQQQH